MVEDGVCAGFDREGDRSNRIHACCRKPVGSLRDWLSKLVGGTVLLLPMQSLHCKDVMRLFW
jgi:hypothetical protein